MALIDRLGQTKLGLGGSAPVRVANPVHVFDPSNDPQRLALSDKLVPLDNSKYGLKGKTPEKIKGTEKSSDTHAFDPKPGVGGDEQYRVKSTLDLNGKTPTNVSNPVHVFDPNNDPQRLALSDTLVPLDNSKYGLKGKKPNILPSALRSSNTHVQDPNVNDLTNNNLDRKQILANRANNVLIAQSNFDLDGETPNILPSALRSSATHVYDPDFSTGQATDPLLNLTGEALKLAQTNRRGNNTVTFRSAYAIPSDKTKVKYQDQATGGDFSAFTTPAGITPD